MVLEQAKIKEQMCEGGGVGNRITTEALDLMKEHRTITAIGVSVLATGAAFLARNPLGAAAKVAAKFLDTAVMDYTPIGMAVEKVLGPSEAKILKGTTMETVGRFNVWSDKNGMPVKLEGYEPAILTDRFSFLRKPSGEWDSHSNLKVWNVKRFDDGSVGFNLPLRNVVLRPDGSHDEARWSPPG